MYILQKCVQEINLEQNYHPIAKIRNNINVCNEKNSE